MGDRRGYIFSGLAVALLLLLGGCRKELCYEEYHPHSRRVMVEVDYAQMDTVPDEMRINFYSLETGEELTRFVSPKKPYVDLPVGRFRGVLFNDNSEYVSLRREDDYTEISAFLSPLTRAQYNMIYGGNPVARMGDNGEAEDVYGAIMEKPQPIDPSAQLIGQPDYLYVAKQDTLEVTNDPTLQHILRLYPENQVSLCYIKAEVTGLEYVQQVRGMLTNVSPGVRLHDLKRDPYTAVVMFDFKKETGCITATVASFGFLINEEGGGTAQHIINIEFLLSDNSVYRTSFQLNPVPDTEPHSLKKIILDPITIDAPASTGGGGFDVGIDDWLDEETIPVN